MRETVRQAVNSTLFSLSAHCMKSSGLGSLADFLTFSYFIYIKDTKSSNSRRKHLPKDFTQLLMPNANWSFLLLGL